MVNPKRKAFPYGVQLGLRGGAEGGNPAPQLVRVNLILIGLHHCNQNPVDLFISIFSSPFPFLLLSVSPFLRLFLCLSLSLFLCFCQSLSPSGSLSLPHSISISVSPSLLFCLCFPSLPPFLCRSLSVPL